MGKASENKRLKEAKLYNTAFELFLCKGTNQTTIDDIVKKAGVAKGTFYLYFKDKYDIMDKLVEQHVNRLFRQAIESLGQEQEKDTEYILKIVDYIVDRLSEDKDLTNFIHKNLSYGVFKSVMVATEESILERMISVIEKSGVHMKNPEITIFMIIELVAGTCYNSILFEQPLPIGEFKPHLYNAVKCLMING